MNAARVLVDGAWRDCIWTYPLHRLDQQPCPSDRDDEIAVPSATVAMVGGLSLLEGTNHRYTVANNSMLYTVTVDMAFDGGNNLCKVVSVLAENRVAIGGLGSAAAAQDRGDSRSVDAEALRTPQANRHILSPLPPMQP